MTCQMRVISKRRVTRNEAAATAVWTQNGAYAPGVVQRPPRAGSILARSAGPCLRRHKAAAVSSSVTLMIYQMATTAGAGRVRQ